MLCLCFFIAVFVFDIPALSPWTEEDENQLRLISQKTHTCVIGQLCSQPIPRESRSTDNGFGMRRTWDLSILTGGSNTNESNTNERNTYGRNGVKTNSSGEQKETAAVRSRSADQRRKPPVSTRNNCSGGE